MDVPGADLLMNMNSGGGGAPDTKLPEMESVSLDFTDLPNDPPPTLASSRPPKMSVQLRRGTALRTSTPKRI